MTELIPYIIWEKQEGYLCAQHCINSLLQGEYFTAVELGEIASNLDKAEQAALREGTTESTENLQHDETPQKSQNMDDSVCRDTKDQPEDEPAYICNLAEHWFTLRKFGGHSSRWYNLDSLLNGPKYISPTYLGMLLKQLENE
ncbi:14633_t:CDS:2, partial [Acaulospora morrowiae]